MRLGMIGLGRMGANMTTRLLAAGHQIVVYDRDDEVVKTAQAGGAEGASTLQQVVDALPAPRVVWVMVPSGDPTEESVMSLAELMEPGDTIIDGGSQTFGQVTLDFSKPVDFDAPYGDQSKYGFNYLGWMECLPHAVIETGDSKYINRFIDLIRQWYEVRDTVTGPRPMSPVFYELGLWRRSARFLSFLQTLRLLDMGDLLTPDDVRIFFKSLLGAGRWLTLEQTPQRDTARATRSFTVPGRCF